MSGQCEECGRYRDECYCNKVECAACETKVNEEDAVEFDDEWFCGAQCVAVYVEVNDLETKA